MDNIHLILKALVHSNKRNVLATIIHVDGSAYRREGTTMLVQEEGPAIGVLSGGCLEEDLALRAEEMLCGEGKPEILAYDLRDEDDLGWGRGAGCGGLLQVLIEPVDDALKAHLVTLKQFLDQGVPVTLARPLADGGPGGYFFIPEGNDTWFGERRGKGSEPEMTESAIRELRGIRKSGLVKRGDRMDTWYIHRFQPRPKLYIFGAGPDARPLAALAADIGFAVIVSDPRPAFCSRGFFPAAEELLHGFPQEVLPVLSLHPEDSVVVMTHNFQQDREILERLRSKKLRYAGLLGSTRRAQRLLEGERAPEGLQSPAGLPIGAEGPEEIAVSIMAELIRSIRVEGGFR